MAGLPHFTNSLAGINNYEPVFLNQFQVLITPPPGIVDANITFNGESVLTQQVKSATKHSMQWLDREHSICM